MILWYSNFQRLLAWEISIFIATDASSNDTANSIFENTGWPINFVSILSQLTNIGLSQGFEFLNGIKGQGAFGFALPVASRPLMMRIIAPLVHLNLVKWNDNVTVKRFEVFTRNYFGKSGRQF